MDLGVTVIDMGGGTTTIGVFFDGNLIFADAVPVGGSHVTNDIARGLSTPLAHAERLKALFGSAIASTLDERETIAVPQIGEEEDGHVNHVPKALLVSIISAISFCRIDRSLKRITALPWRASVPGSRSRASGSWS